MGDQQNTVQIRSFRVVFDLERRLHKIDRWRIPLPYGIPVRSLVYALAALVAVLVVARLPLAGALVGALPPAVRYVIIPVGIAYGLTQVRIDGRPAHRALLALARDQAGARRLVAFRAAPAVDVVTFDTVAIAGDERTSRYRPAEIRGPVTLRLRYPLRATQRRSTLVLEQAGSRPLRKPKRLDLKAGQKVVVK